MVVPERQLLAELVRVGLREADVVEKLAQRPPPGPLLARTAGTPSRALRMPLSARIPSIVTTAPVPSRSPAANGSIPRPTTRIVTSFASRCLARPTDQVDRGRRARLRCQRRAGQRSPGRAAARPAPPGARPSTIDGPTVPAPVWIADRPDRRVVVAEPDARGEDHRDTERSRRPGSPRGRRRPLLRATGGPSPRSVLVRVADPAVPVPPDEARRVEQLGQPRAEGHGGGEREHADGDRQQAASHRHRASTAAGLERHANPRHGGRRERGFGERRDDARRARRRWRSGTRGRARRGEPRAAQRGRARSPPSRARRCPARAGRSTRRDPARRCARSRSA